MGKKSRTKAEVEHKLLVSECQNLRAYKQAYDALLAITKEKYHLSGVILTITDLSGKVLVQPVCINDGLSNASINSLREDIKKSADYTLLMNQLK